MEDFRKPPTRAQQWLAIVLSILAMVGFGGLTGILWFYAHFYIAGSIFGLFFLLSAWLFYRAVSTAPRSLGTGELQVVSWAFIVFSVVGIIGSVFLPGHHKLAALGPSLSMLAAGLSGISHGRRDA